MRLTAQQLRVRFAELMDLVNAWDPIGLIADGAPDDEYHCIVGPVLRRLEEKQSAAAIAKYLDEEFRDHFECVPNDPVSFATRAVSWYRERWPDTESTPLGDSR